MVWSLGCYSSKFSQCDWDQKNLATCCVRCYYWASFHSILSGLKNSCCCWFCCLWDHPDESALDLLQVRSIELERDRVCRRRKERWRRRRPRRSSIWAHFGHQPSPMAQQPLPLGMIISKKASNEQWTEWVSERDAECILTYICTPRFLHLEKWPMTYSPF